VIRDFHVRCIHRFFDPCQATYLCGARYVAWVNPHLAGSRQLEYHEEQFFYRDIGMAANLEVDSLASVGAELRTQWERLKQEIDMF